MGRPGCDDMQGPIRDSQSPGGPSWDSVDGPPQRAPGTRDPRPWAPDPRPQAPGPGPWALGPSLRAPGARPRAPAPRSQAPGSGRQALGPTGSAPWAPGPEPRVWGPWALSLGPIPIRALMGMGQFRCASMHGPISGLHAPRGYNGLALMGLMQDPALGIPSLGADPLHCFVF